MKKNSEIEKLKQVLMDKIKSENDSRYTKQNPDEIMKIVIDSSIKGKYVFWVLREYLKDNIQRFEDMGRVKQALILFKNNLSKFSEQEKQLNKLSFQELETLVSSYQEVLTQNEIKRIQKEKIWSEIDVIYEGAEGKIYVPKTEQAAIFLGQGTRWCTGSTNNNMFDYYNKQGLMYVFVLPEKDKQGREIKYQAHFESDQFMDSEDTNVVSDDLANISFLTNILFDSLSETQKGKYLSKSDIFCDLFKEKIDDVFESLSDVDKIKHFLNEFRFRNRFHQNDFYKNKYDELTDIMINLNCNPYDFPGETASEITLETYIKMAKNGNLSIKNVLAKNIDLELPKILIEDPDLNIDDVLDYIMTNKNFALLLTENDLTPIEYWKKIISGLINTGKIEKIIEKNSNFFGKVPDSLKTAEICKMAVEQNGRFIGGIPNNIMTYEMCEIAVKNDCDVLHLIPEKYITKKLCEIAIKKNGTLIDDVPEQFITDELCRTAIKENVFSLQSIPEKYITKELCELVVLHEQFIREPTAFEHIPDNMKTKELCDLALEQNILVFKDIPNEFKTRELSEKAVSKNGFLVNYVPREFSSQEMLEKATNSQIFCAEVLYSLPDEMITQELCKKYIEKDGLSLKYVPKRFRTKEFCEIAMQQNVNAFEFVPEQMKTYEMCKNAVESESQLFFDVPEEFQSKELILTVAKNDIFAFEHILGMMTQSENFFSENELTEIFDSFLQKNEYKYTVDEAIKMFFSQGNNIIKKTFDKKSRHIKNLYIDRYINIISEEISNKYKHEKTSETLKI